MRLSRLKIVLSGLDICTTVCVADSTYIHRL